MKKTIIFICFLFPFFLPAQEIGLWPVDTLYPDTTVEERYATCVSSLGDINGDGYEDVGIAFSTGIVSTGQLSRVIIYYGNESMNFEIGWFYRFPRRSEDTRSQYSAVRSIENIGDINGDGWDDLAVGMPNFELDCISGMGRVWLFFGGPDMDTIPDWEWSGSSIMFYHYFGIKIARLGDWNLDGYDDFAVSAPWNDGGGEGQVYLIYGANSPDSFSCVELSGIEEEEHFGKCMTSADINGDGQEELLITNNVFSESESTYTINLFSYFRDNVDTLLTIVLYDATLGVIDELEYILDVVSQNERDIVFFNYIIKAGYWLEQDSCVIYKIQYSDTEELEVDIFDPSVVFSIDDTLNKSFARNFTEIQDLTDDGVNEIVCEIPELGRLYILNCVDSLYTLYFDSLYEFEIFPLISRDEALTTLDFNDDGYYEVAVSIPGINMPIIIYSTREFDKIQRKQNYVNFNTLNTFLGNTIYFKDNMICEATFRLFDIKGRIVINKQFQIKKGGNAIKCENLESGVYFYSITRLIENESVITGKLINIK